MARGRSLRALGHNADTDSVISHIDISQFHINERLNEDPKVERLVDCQRLELNACRVWRKINFRFFFYFLAILNKMMDLSVVFHDDKSQMIIHEIGVTFC